MDILDAKNNQADDAEENHAPDNILDEDNHEADNQAEIWNELTHQLFARMQREFKLVECRVVLTPKIKEAESNCKKPRTRRRLYPKRAPVLQASTSNEEKHDDDYDDSKDLKNRSTKKFEKIVFQNFWLIPFTQFKFEEILSNGTRATSFWNRNMIYPRIRAQIRALRSTIFEKFLRSPQWSKKFRNIFLEYNLPQRIVPRDFLQFGWVVSEKRSPQWIFVPVIARGW